MAGRVLQGANPNDLPLDEVAVEEMGISRGNAAQLGLTLTWTKLRHPLTDTLYSFASSKTLVEGIQRVIHSHGVIKAAQANYATVNGRVITFTVRSMVAKN